MDEVNEVLTDYSILQERVFAVMKKNNWGINPAERIEKISEEIVEFYEELYNQENDFGYLEAATCSEAADIVITLMGFLSVYDVNLLDEVALKVDAMEAGKREPRGWRKKIHIRKQNVENGVRLTITALKA